MDFGFLSHREASPNAAIPGSTEPKNDKANGSWNLKEKRSELAENSWRVTKMPRPFQVEIPSKKTENFIAFGRSNIWPSGGDDGQKMLSFSSSEPHCQNENYRRTRGGLNEGIRGPFARLKGPFTPSQWMELERQALIYKHIMANVPIPSNLLVPVWSPLNPYASSGSYSSNFLGWGPFHLGFSGSNDPEPGRCRRTDGKKWRCSRDAVPDQKYCERHINRGRHRSRKPVEGQTGHAVSGSTTSSVAPIASSSALVMSSSLSAMQHKPNSLQPNTVNLVNRFWNFIHWTCEFNQSTPSIPASELFGLLMHIAWKVGDPEIPRPWSRYSWNKQGSSLEEENIVAGSKSSKVAAAKGEIKNGKKDYGNGDPKFQEFLQVMQPRSKSKLWANDAPAAPSLQQSTEASNKKREVKGSHEKLDELNVEFEGTEVRNDIFSENQEAVKANSLVHNKVVSDMDYFRSRVKKEWSDFESNDDDAGDSDFENDSDRSGKTLNNNYCSSVEDTLKRDVPEGEAEDGCSEESSNKKFKSAVPSSSAKDEKERILETGHLVIRNLLYSTTEEELEEHFSKFGDISEVHLVVDKETKRFKGRAYVVYVLPESAARAMEKLNNSSFQGRLLHISSPKEKNPSDKQETNSFTQQRSKTFKQQRKEERKASEASGNTRGWNSLFMRTDTVVENVARKFGVSKSELLDREADDLAVRIALGETKVIAETKKALSNAGINVALLESASWKTDGLERSSRVILVKNLPYASSECELADMFRKFGNLDKVILPPTKTLALVIFVEPADAFSSFEGLHYKCYKGAPLFLELVPGYILSQTPIAIGDSNNNVIVGECDSKRILQKQQLEDKTDEDVDPDRIESRSLCVKNLSFKTSDEKLKRHFTEHVKEGRILSVRVNKHFKNGKNVSKGFGFIEFDSVDTAVKVCRDLQETKLDGHALVLQLCRAKKGEHQHKKVDSNKSSTKLIIKNVAFEATVKDLRQLFSPFGQVKSLRLPKRFGKHNGFAFVEYVTKQECQNALQALSNTHLYGRHLVLERAREGESLEELRTRTAAQFTDSTKLPKKRKHVTLLDGGNVKFELIAN
ncbi:unnamed protein product [Fraxinus pennsylvanica]|uniref:Uncharacterized protein n=1 Tax=Fraxinus pennsylvanica TaxID=56036 RepID=A0AAD1YKU4_9LAMI|nr:unnamed protein product [Fraxinus pennsylvanica]